MINQKIIVAAGQLGLTGGAQPIFVFFPNPRKTSIQLLLEAQQHKKYAQTTPLDDGVSSLFISISIDEQKTIIAYIVIHHFFMFNLWFLLFLQHLIEKSLILSI
jgi:hypothetical protein